MSCYCLCKQKLNRVTPSVPPPPPSVSAILSMIQEQHVDWEAPAALASVLSNDSNKRCIDCASTHQVEWASLGFGTLVCLKCAGFHRSLGVHITAVKSTTLDRWTDREVQCLVYGGNERYQSYYSLISIRTTSTEDMYLTLPPLRGVEKYTVAQLLFYSKILKDRIANDLDGVVKVGEGSDDRIHEVAIDSDAAVSGQTNNQDSDLAALLNSFIEDDWMDTVKYVKEAVRNYNRHVGGGGGAGSNISLTTTDSSLQGPSGPSFKSPAEKRQLMCSWVEDSTVVSCMICGTDFTFFTRRHHCRRCGRMVCSQCAPSDNSRPIPEWGLMDPVRHCKLCYKSPMVQWTKS